MNDLEELQKFVGQFDTKGEAAKALNMSPQQLSNYLAGRINIGSSVREKLRAAGHYTSDEVAKLTVREPPILYQGIQDTVIYVPFYLRKANAGIGIDFEVLGEMQFPVLRSRVKHPNKTFAVGVSGESMKELGMDDHTVLICEFVDDGDLSRYVGKRVVVGYEGASYVKTVVKIGGKYYLRSENSDKKSYPDMDLNPNLEWKVIAVVIGTQNYW